MRTGWPASAGRKRSTRVPCPSGPPCFWNSGARPPPPLPSPFSPLLPRPLACAKMLWLHTCTCQCAVRSCDRLEQLKCILRSKPRRPGPMHHVVSAFVSVSASTLPGSADSRRWRMSLGCQTSKGLNACARNLKATGSPIHCGSNRPKAKAKTKTIRMAHSSTMTRVVSEGQPMPFSDLATHSIFPFHSLIRSSTMNLLCPFSPSLSVFLLMFFFVSIAVYTFDA
jgi:hypothetical protein